MQGETERAKHAQQDFEVEYEKLEAPRIIKHKLERELEEYRDMWVQRLMDYLQHRELFESLYSKLVGFCTSISMSGDMDVRLAGGKAELLEAVRIIRQAGFICSSDRPKAGDTTWTAYWRKPGVKVAVYFSFSSTVCKRVQVGTKMEPMPIYETRCDTDLAAIAEAVGSTMPVAADDIPF